MKSFASAAYRVQQPVHDRAQTLLIRIEEYPWSSSKALSGTFSIVSGLSCWKHQSATARTTPTRQRIVFLSTFIKSLDEDRFVFGRFHSQVKKHHLLAVFSTVRLHEVRSSMNLRQVLEAGSCAAFAIAEKTQAQPFCYDGQPRGAEFLSKADRQNL